MTAGHNPGNIRLLGPAASLHAFLGRDFTAHGMAVCSETTPDTAWVWTPLFSGDPDAEPFLSDLQSETPPERLVLVSSASVYGDGDYACGDCGPMPHMRRDTAHMGKYRWEIFCPLCNEMLMPQPIPENSLARPISSKGHFYAAAEATLLALDWDIPLIILRVFEPCWPAAEGDPAPSPGEWDTVQLLARRLINHEPVLLDEDAYGLRDFTAGADVAQAIRLALTAPLPAGVTVFNIGSGDRMTLQSLTAYLQEGLNRTDVPYRFDNTFRPEAARHRLADIRRAQAVLGYRPTHGCIDGVLAYCHTQLANR